MHVKLYVDVCIKCLLKASGAGCRQRRVLVRMFEQKTDVCTCLCLSTCLGGFAHLGGMQAECIYGFAGMSCVGVCVCLRYYYATCSNRLQQMAG